MRALKLFLGGLSLVSSIAIAEGGAIDGGLLQLKSYRIEIFGMGPAADAKAVKQVRRVIGAAVADGTLDEFIVQGYGIEGGFGACVTMSPWATSEQSAEFMNKLTSIKPNPNTTSYNIQDVNDCNHERR